MTLRKKDIIELEIEKIAYGGRGIGRADGFVVFVRGAIPGDRITARVYKKKKDYAEAYLIDLLERSPDRVAPACPYSGYCGGCQLQNVRYAAQLSYKREHIKEALERIGGLENIRVHNVIPSDDQFGYRNKMEFSFSDRRWLLPDELGTRDTEDNFALGLHIPGAFQKVLDIDACLLQKEGGNNILREVKKFARHSGIPVYNLKTHIGIWRFLTIRYSRALARYMVNIVTSEDVSGSISPLIDTLDRRFKDVVTVVNNITIKKAAVAVGEKQIVLKGDGHIEDKIGPFTFQISANSFFQTNTRAAEKLYQKAAEFADLKGNETVLDLYSGTGTLPVFLSGRSKEITGMEISTSAILDAQKNCRANGVDNCRFVLGDIREQLSSMTVAPDVIIIDPPRAGMHQDVLNQVLTLSAKTIVYISCNPATLARDIGMMAQAYEVVEIQPVDMFPHTYHVEAVAKLHFRKTIAR